MKKGDVVKIINNDNNTSDEHIIRQMDKLIGKQGRVVEVVNNLVDVQFYSPKYGIHRTYCFKRENLEIVN